MESVTQPIVYTFKAPILEVKGSHTLRIDMGNSCVLDLHCNTEDIEHLLKNDLITIKVEIPNAKPQQPSV